MEVQARRDRQTNTQRHIETNTHILLGRHAHMSKTTVQEQHFYDRQNNDTLRDPEIMKTVPQKEKKKEREK